MNGQQFPKEQRLCGRKAIANLFENGKRISRYPLQLVYFLSDADEKQVSGIQILVSVSKRNFRLAHDRNRLKRQIREAWRLSRQILHEKKSEVPDRITTKALHIAFIYQSGKKEPYSVTREAMENSLRILAGKFSSA